jgi:hypothetical protein
VSLVRLHLHARSHHQKQPMQHMALRGRNSQSGKGCPMGLHCAQSVHVSQWNKVCPDPRGMQPLSSDWPIAAWRHPCALQRQVLPLAAYRYQLWRICFTHICCMKVKLMRVKVSRHRCIWCAHVCVLAELPDSGKGRGAKQGLSGDPRDLSTVLWLKNFSGTHLNNQKNFVPYIDHAKHQVVCKCSYILWVVSAQESAAWDIRSCICILSISLNIVKI